MSAAVGHYTGDLHDDLRRMVTAIWDATGRRRTVIPAILSELATNEELRSAASHSVREMGRVTEILARYQRRGLLINEPPLHAYAALAGPLVYLGIVSRLLPDLPELDINAHVEKYLRGHSHTENHEDN